jgi:hypothetical protein
MPLRSLLKRLEKLEFRSPPAGEPTVIKVQFVSSDGTEIDVARFVVQSAADSHPYDRLRPGRWR